MSQWAREERTDGWGILQIHNPMPTLGIKPGHSCKWSKMQQAYGICLRAIYLSGLFPIQILSEDSLHWQIQINPRCKSLQPKRYHGTEVCRTRPLWKTTRNCCMAEVFWLKVYLEKSYWFTGVYCAENCLVSSTLQDKYNLFIDLEGRLQCISIKKGYFCYIFAINATIKKLEVCIPDVIL